MQYVAMWMELEDIMLNKARSKEDSYRIISYVVR